MILRKLPASRRHRLPILLASALALTLGLSACNVSSTDTAASNASETSSETTDANNTAAATDPGADQHTVYAQDGIAIEGADPVAYFTQEAFVEGSADFTHEWKGVTWQFASAENRDLFASEPEKYAPQYGGYCAWAVGQNALAAIDPNAWSVVDGKLYLNANDRIQSRWNKDIPGNIALADANWPKLSAQ